MNRMFLYILITLTRIFSDFPLLWMFYFLHFHQRGSGEISDALFNTALFILFGALHSLYLLVGTVLEERNLREELGEIYDLYRANVPMWIPRLKPWSHELT